MNSGNPIKISEASYGQILTEAGQFGLAEAYIPEKHQWQISSNTDWLVRINLPWDSVPDENGRLKKKDDHHLALVMIRAGIATTGYFHNGVMLDHKVFRAYMVRQKQGKSQIKYLKTKGKSRAGSRVRLGETEEFFREINHRLLSYDKKYPIDTWGMSCAKTLFPYFFSCEPAPPFSKNQANLFSIPFHVQHPGLETLELMHKKLNQFHGLISESGAAVFDFMVKPIRPNPAENELDEDW
jgi:hypothetical protein